ncbi:MAG: hypothetical protein KA201_29555 [Kofleriaceae bacterium]|nr:hypothetical protein [Kofleriaceae bacterium]
MRAAALGALLATAACGVDKMPPIVMLRRGPAAPVKRVAILPAECGTAVCKGIDAIVAADLAFRGYDVVELDRLAAIERARTEVQVSVQDTSGPTMTNGSTRTVTVTGAMLSDVDVWTLRAELAAMGVDGLVRVRTAELEGWPERVEAMVRVTRTADASLVWSTLCELEVSVLDLADENAERAVRCALAGGAR